MKRRIGTPYQDYSEETERRLDQMELKNIRKIYEKPTMTVEEMKEILRPKEESGISVTFLKKKRS